MRKKIKKIIISTLLMTVLCLVTTITLILNPQVLFAEKVVYRNFNIYSNYTIPDSYKSAIDYTIEVITASEIYEPNHQLDIFLCYESSFNEIDSRLLGSTLAKSVHNNLLIKVPADFDKNILIGWNSKRNLKKTIAHEAMHFFQMNKYGMLKFNPINHPPMWKLEGYPEYISYQKDLKAKDYDLKDSIRKIKEFEKTGEYYFETEPGQFDPLVYYKGRVMIEYLIDIKGMTYNEILSDSVTEGKVIREMTAWYEGQKGKE